MGLGNSDTAFQARWNVAWLRNAFGRQMASLRHAASPRRLGRGLHSGSTSQQNVEQRCRSSSPSLLALCEGNERRGRAKARPLLGQSLRGLLHGLALASLPHEPPLASDCDLSRPSRSDKRRAPDHRQRSRAVGFRDGQLCHLPGARKLEVPVRLNEQGKARRVSTQEAALLRLREMALKGDARSLDRLLALAQIFNNGAAIESLGTRL